MWLVPRHYFTATTSSQSQILHATHPACRGDGGAKRAHGTGATHGGVDWRGEEEVLPLLICVGLDTWEKSLWSWMMWHSPKHLIANRPCHIFWIGQWRMQESWRSLLLERSNYFQNSTRMMATKMTMYGMCCVAICGMRFKTIEVWWFDLAGSFWDVVAVDDHGFIQFWWWPWWLKPMIVSDGFYANEWCLLWLYTVSLWGSGWSQDEENIMILMVMMTMTAVSKFSWGFVPTVPAVMHQRLCWRGHSKEFWDRRTRCPHSPVVNMNTTFYYSCPAPPRQGREVIICDKLFVIYDVHIICHRYITDDYRYNVSACLDYWLV